MEFLHVGFKVEDIHKSSQLYQRLFGIEWEPITGYQLDDMLLNGEIAPSRTLVTHGRTSSGFEIEMVQCVDGEMPDEIVLGDREGISHVAFAVPDLDAAAAEVEEQGLRRVSEYRSNAVDFAFFHTKELGGALTQLVQFKGPRRSS